jgi:[FeFe] hydrogenase H-cluster maturation GTPase HydF
MLNGVILRISRGEEMAKSIRGERSVVTFIGNRNVGKSSLLNAILEQNVAIVSAQPGTTTDPVHKIYELIPVGPVSFFDTAGLDDVGEVGEKRVAFAKRVLMKTNLAIIVVGDNGITSNYEEIFTYLREQNISFFIVFNKSDIRSPLPQEIEFCEKMKIPFVTLSVLAKKGINELRKMLIHHLLNMQNQQKTIIGDLIKKNDVFILVAPIDKSAPKGRLILPQVQVLREILDFNGIAIVLQPDELQKCLESLKNKPKLVITDSQALETVVTILPPDIAITTFSILFARYKGDLHTFQEGAQAVDTLQDGDKVLIAEACSHHVQDDDIGRIKIPRWLKEYSKKELHIEFASGSDYPSDLDKYKLVIHCGACMLNQAEMQKRIDITRLKKIPCTNYGMIISKLHGVFERTSELLVEKNQDE